MNIVYCFCIFCYICGGLLSLQLTTASKLMNLKTSFGQNMHIGYIEFQFPFKIARDKTPHNILYN